MTLVEKKRLPTYLQLQSVNFGRVDGQDGKRFDQHLRQRLLQALILEAPAGAFQEQTMHVASLCGNRIERKQEKWDQNRIANATERESCAFFLGWPLGSLTDSGRSSTSSGSAKWVTSVNSVERSSGQLFLRQAICTSAVRKLCGMCSPDNHMTSGSPDEAQ